jgi:hypothetical protein
MPNTGAQCRIRQEGGYVEPVNRTGALVVPAGAESQDGWHRRRVISNRSGSRPPVALQGTIPTEPGVRPSVPLLVRGHEKVRTSGQIQSPQPVFVVSIRNGDEPALSTGPRVGAVSVFVYERVSSIRVMMLCSGVQELLCRQNFRVLR